MENKTPSPNGLTALKAAQPGNFREALACLQTAIAEGDSHRDVLMAAAFSARATFNFNFCLETIDRYLLLDPKDINANLIKADALTGLGKTKAASGFYLTAITLAPDVSQLSETHAKEIRRAQAACDAATKHFEKSMSSYLDEIGFKDSGGATRIEQTVDIMMGRKQAYHQTPSKLYIPELPHKQFYDPAAPALSNMGLENDSRWSALHLVKDGVPIEENIKRCPNTYGALSELPIAKISGRSPNILFSLLKPGAIFLRIMAKRMLVCSSTYR